MFVTTTDYLQNTEIRDYAGVIYGEAIVGVHVGKDLLASIRDFFGGRSQTYEQTLKEARDEAYNELVEEARKQSADAVIGASFDYHSLGSNNSMLMVVVTGTAIKLR